MPTKKHTNPAYISHAHLIGYKSITDTEVELHPGLNIIIGPNGSGKTNFCEFIHKLLTFNYPLIPNKFHSEIKMDFNEEEFVWTINVNGKFANIESTQFVKVIEEIFYEPRKKASKSTEYKFLDLTELTGKRNLARNFLIKHFRPSTFIWFSSPRIQSPKKEIDSLENYFTVKVNKKSLELESLNLSPIYFVSNFIFANFLDVKDLQILKSTDALIKALDINEKSIRNLRIFSPIKDVRIGTGVTINENSQQYIIDNIRFEFLVDELWISWNQLSDGTKRIFYIITQVSAFNRGLTIIEEPEIGVHPDQYRKILNFLKEQAENKQIIITTHAPKTLDILEDNELDRIILTRYDNELGTKMRHLSEEEQNHAVKFMKEESFFLSDFWTLTSFFDEEEEVL